MCRYRFVDYFVGDFWTTYVGCVVCQLTYAWDEGGERS